MEFDLEPILTFNFLLHLFSVNKWQKEVGHSKCVEVRGTYRRNPFPPSTVGYRSQLKVPGLTTSSLPVEPWQVINPH